MSILSQSEGPGPRALLGVWIYGFMPGVRSSRELEAACCDQIPCAWLGPDESGTTTPSGGSIRRTGSACERCCGVRCGPRWRRT